VGNAGGRKRRERGVALLLTFLVILILVAVVGEVSVTSAVERGIARHELEDMRCEFAARGAVEVAKALLIRDARETSPQDFDLRPADVESLAVFAGMSGSGAPERSHEGQLQDASADGHRDLQADLIDSFLDAWADPEACSRTFAGDLEATIRVVDEDGKLNLLWLAAEDARLRDIWKDRLRHLLDILREGTAHDLSMMDAERISNGIAEWIQGRRSGKLPRPYLSTMTKRESLAVFGRDRFEAAVDDGPVLFPLGLDELLHVPGIGPELLDGFTERDGYVPGLRDVTTIFTSLLFDPDGATDRETFVWEFMKQQKEWQRREQKRQGARQRALATQILESGAGRINVHTAPVQVLRALCRSAGLSDYVASALDDLRPKRGAEPRDRATLRAGPGVLARLEATSGPIRTLPSIDRADFEAAFGQRSHVFTVLVCVKKAQEFGDGGMGSTGSRASLRVRTVLWRRSDQDGTTQTITLVPLHRWSHPVEGEEEGSTS